MIWNKNLTSIVMAVVALFFLILSDFAFSGDLTNKSTAPVSDLSVESPEKDMVVVYYFHRTLRCTTCMIIEELTTAAVQGNFAQEINSGKVQLKILNMEGEQKPHFESDYQLSAQSIIVSKMSNGVEVKWKNLDKIWEYVDDGELFMEYIKGEVDAYL